MLVDDHVDKLCRKASVYLDEVVHASHNLSSRLNRLKLRELSSKDSLDVSSVLLNKLSALLVNGSSLANTAKNRARMSSGMSRSADVSVGSQNPWSSNISRSTDVGVGSNNSWSSDVSRSSDVGVGSNNSWSLSFFWSSVAFSEWALSSSSSKSFFQLRLS